MGGRSMTQVRAPGGDHPTLEPPTAAAWEKWLRANHDKVNGVWLRITRKTRGSTALTVVEALDVALCYGWIDGLRKRESETTYLQKYTPRRARSTWSKINREKVQALIDAGRMQPAGVAEIDRAKADGRWEAAYDPWRSAQPSPALAAALDASPRARAFWETLDRHNRFAIIFRSQTAAKPETRDRRIAKFIAMLERGEKIHDVQAQRLKGSKTQR
jgi:uncharacterized protein YdeI (YjbR/CyaY-like superfamily)